MSVRILIISAKNDNSNQLAAILDKKGYKTLLINSLQDAKEVCAKFLPEILIIGSEFTHTAISDFCDELQRKSKTCSTIVLAALDRIEKRQKILETGATDYILYPPEPNEVIKKVETYSEYHKLRLMSRNHDEKMKRLNEVLNEQRLIIEQKNQDFQDSISYALSIQNSLLPSIEQIRTVFPESFVYYKPRDVVSGDFYLFTVKNDTVIAIVADCTGHGVPGALLSVLGITIFNNLIEQSEILDPAILLNRMDKELTHFLLSDEKIEQSQDGMDIAICAINLKNKSLKFSGSKHPLYLIRNNKLVVYQGSIFTVGGGLFHDTDSKEFFNTDIALRKNDSLYMFSDGYIDQFGGKHSKKFLPRQFKNLLMEINSKPLAEQKEILSNTLEKWKGGQEQIDDILVMGLRI